MSTDNPSVQQVNCLNMDEIVKLKAQETVAIFDDGLNFGPSEFLCDFIVVFLLRLHNFVSWVHQTNSKHHSHTHSHSYRQFRETSPLF